MCPKSEREGVEEIRRAAQQNEGALAPRMLQGAATKKRVAILVTS